MATIHLTKAGFENRVADIAKLAEGWNFKGQRPALIDFYAKWCGPCQRLSPIIDELADEYDGRVDIYKVDVDAEQELAKLFKIGVPSGFTTIAQYLSKSSVVYLYPLTPEITSLSIAITLPFNVMLFAL